jgi:hypothetical protein
MGTLVVLRAPPIDEEYTRLGHRALSLTPRELAIIARHLEFDDPVNTRAT